ncbi:glycosyltransferase family 2 protein [Glutamicibacter protophormiae]|uniref:glycosyltransferase family 2 protein n=1 Tax=Glutamicibacter protophormiae TaxID=37930 RepID=UPI003A949EDC
MTSSVVAIVVTYNSREHINTLLESLPAAFDDTAYSVVVVDNGSVDGTADVVARRTDVTIVRSTNTGFASGINKGARHAAIDATILVLNPDATMSPGSVSNMMGVLRRSGVGIVAPRMYEADGSLSPSLRRAPSLMRAGGLSFTGLAAFAERIEDPQEYEREHEVDWAVGAVMLISRPCFDALGGFDESFFLYSEETDFCLRAKDAGWRTMYTPAAQVMHIGGGSGESAATHTMKMVNRVRIYGRRHGRLATWAYYGIAVLTELRRGLFGHSQSWVAFRALVTPSRRPPEIGANDRLLPI